MPSDLNLASAYSLLILVMSVSASMRIGARCRTRSRFATVTGKAFSPRITKLGRWRPLVTAHRIVVALLLAAGLPILVLVWNAFMPYPQAPSRAAWSWSR